MNGVKKIERFRPNTADSVFITCASFEERCLGVLRGFDENYSFDNAYVFKYEHPDERREIHLAEMERILKPKGHLEQIVTLEDDPLPALGELAKKLKKLNLSSDNSIVTLDITTFTKRHLLLLFETIDSLGLWDILRIYYTPPKDYVVSLYLPMSIGIRKIALIPGFVGHTALSRPTLLVILLGYEGDRAKTIYENLDPNEALLVVPDPPYHEEWRGRTEEMNKHLLKIIGEDKVKGAHSQDPVKMALELEEIFKEYPLDDWRCSIAPLGTKPQVLGLYLFWRKNKGKFSIIYAHVLRHNEPFFSTGVDQPLLLLSPKQ